MSLQQFGVILFEIKNFEETSHREMENTEAPLVREATEDICKFY